MPPEKPAGQNWRRSRLHKNVHGRVANKNHCCRRKMLSRWRCHQSPSWRWFALTKVPKGIRDGYYIIGKSMVVFYNGVNAIWWRSFGASQKDIGAPVQQLPRKRQWSASSLTFLNIVLASMILRETMERAIATTINIENKEDNNEKIAGARDKSLLSSQNAFSHQSPPWRWCALT